MLTHEAFKKPWGRAGEGSGDGSPTAEITWKSLRRATGRRLSITEMGDGFELVIEMRKKEWKLIVTFHTTADAIAFEKSCKESNKDGRMIPVPKRTVRWLRACLVR